MIRLKSREPIYKSKFLNALLSVVYIQLNFRTKLFNYYILTIVVTTEQEIRTVLDKLDSVKLELIRLRAMLLPEEELTTKEKKELKQALKEIKQGKTVKLEDILEKF